METYTVQLTLAVTVTVDHDRPNNTHLIPQYDAYDHAYAVIADFIRNTPNVSLVISDDLTADVRHHH